MAENSPESIKTNVIGSLISAALLAVGGAVWVFVPNAWAWLSDSTKLVWAHLIGSSTVPTWWLYLLYLVGVLALAAVALSVFALRRTSTGAVEPTYLDYTEDRLLGAVWRWRYEDGVLAGTWAFCPHCDTRLVYSHQGSFYSERTVFYCETCEQPICSQAGDKNAVVAKVHRQIDRKIRNGEWKNYVQRSGEGQT